MTKERWRIKLLHGVSELAAHDAVLRPYTVLFAEPSFRPHENYYQELVESIISQQLSVKAAATINERFVQLFAGTFPDPEAIMKADTELLRSAGLSGQKAGYIKDLAGHMLRGELNFENIDMKSNEEIVTILTAVKGIGEWTAHMFLIFSMGRLNVLAYGDLGVRNAAKILYGLKELPGRAELEELAVQRKWTGYESIACWYLWKSLDNEPV